jgi:hypothetical protein
MKIVIDGIWHFIDCDESGEIINLKGVSASAFNSIVQAALTPGQFKRYAGDQGITFTISKKKEKAMREEIEKQKQIFKIKTL